MKSLLTKSEVEFLQSITIPEFSTEQINEIRKRTPESEIEVKTDKQGFKYKSVKAAYVKKRMIQIFGWNYSFEIKSREFIPSTKEVIVEGRLTVHINTLRKENTIVREQFGQFYLNSRTNNTNNRTTTHAIDIGNGYKAAATDAFKKCASEFGICWDIYFQETSETKKEEVPEQDQKDIKKIERLTHFLEQCQKPAECESVYERFLETGIETDDSKNILKVHIKRTMKNL